MEKWQKLLGSALAAAAITTAGCKGSSSIKNMFSKSDKPSPRNTSVASAGRGVGHGGPVEEKGISDSIASGWKSMTGKVSDALTIKPKEVKAPDPVSLDSDPGPINPAFFVATAEIHERTGKFDLAQKEYGKALKAEPNNKAALIGIARLHDRQGQFQLAEKAYIRAIKVHPKEADFFNDLGLCLARQKKSELAAGALNKAVELEPQKVLYRNNLATVLVDLGKHDEALKHFSVAQDEAVAHYNLGYLLAQRNETAAAIRHLSIAHQMKPEFSQAEQMLAKLGAAQPPVTNARSYRITDREEVAEYSKPQIPARLTSGVMLSRLPATEIEEPSPSDESGFALPETTENAPQAVDPVPDVSETKTVPKDQSQDADWAGELGSESDEPSDATDELAPEADQPADEPVASDDAESDDSDAESAESAEPRNSAFVPDQPEKLTPPEP